jgi:hypothetical protein
MSNGSEREASKATKKNKHVEFGLANYSKFGAVSPILQGGRFGRRAVTAKFGAAAVEIAWRTGRRRSQM